MKNPNIRFVDDNTDWEERKLKDVSIPTKSKTLTREELFPDGKYPVINGGTSYYGFYNDYNNEDAFTISARGEAGFCRFNKGRFWAGGLCYPYKGNNNFDTYFIAVLLNKYQKYIKENYVIRTSIPAVNKSDIEQFCMRFPTKSIQQKISSLLSNIDQKINAEETLLQKLKDAKSAMLSKMFPQENQSVPELRFVGFVNAWEQRKLDDIVGIYDGVHQTPNYQNDGIMFLSVENITTLKSSKFISEEDFKRDYKVFPQENDILMTRIGDVGTTNVVTDNDLKAYYVSLALLKYKGTDPYFLSNAIQSNYVQKGLANRTLKAAVPMKINKDEIGKVSVMLPLSATEQQQIGTCFRTLDHLIALHQRKLKKYKEIKSALLDKLLV